MSKITAIATAVPKYCQQQMEIFDAVKAVHSNTPEEERILRFMYKTSGINTRYSVVPDFSSTKNNAQIFYTENEEIKTRGLEARLKIYEENALQLSKDVIYKCIDGKINPQEVTHLITVSCTGMQAPGLDLSIIKELGLSNNIYRTSVNFMGCYAAIHGLKQAYYIAAKEPDAKVLVVCVELCTLHFQKEKTPDNITSTVIFSDGAAAVLVEGDGSPKQGWRINDFYSDIDFDGIEDMAWKISSEGFLMTLTSNIPDILEHKCGKVIDDALRHYNIHKEAISTWCIHPGGRRILEAIEKGSGISKQQMAASYEVLSEYGNMSSPTILFVLERIINQAKHNKSATSTIGMAFGPGLTLETFHLTHD